MATHCGLPAATVSWQKHQHRCVAHQGSAGTQAYLASSSDEEKPAGNAAKYKALLGTVAGPGKQRTGAKAWGAPEQEAGASSSDGSQDAEGDPDKVRAWLPALVLWRQADAS